MWDEETSGPLVGAANTRSHFASLITRARPAVSPRLYTLLRTFSERKNYAGVPQRSAPHIAPCWERHLAPSLYSWVLVGIARRLTTRQRLRKAEHSFHLHISYLSNARSINFAEGARLLLAQETVTAEQFPAIHSVVRKEKSAASVESD